MPEKYDLKSLAENPELFERLVGEYAVESLEELHPQGALVVDPHELAQAAFDKLQHRDMDAEIYQALLLPYVKKHFLEVFATSVQNWQRQKMIDNYVDSPLRLGEQYELVIDQHSRAAIEVVVLDEDMSDIDAAQLVYHYMDRMTSEGWTVGTIADAVDECMRRRTS